MSKNKIVLVFGTFDILHKGHLNFFEQANKFGNKLIVVVARDTTVTKIKGEIPRNNELKRLKQVEKNSMVNRAVLGKKIDKYEIIQEIKPDVICLGYDQNAFTKNLKFEINKLNLETKIYRMKPYKEKIYKSSKLTKKIWRKNNSTLKQNKNQNSKI